MPARSLIEAVRSVVSVGTYVPSATHTSHVVPSATSSPAFTVARAVAHVSPSSASLPFVASTWTTHPPPPPPAPPPPVPLLLLVALLALLLEAPPPEPPAPPTPVDDVVLVPLLASPEVVAAAAVAASSPPQPTRAANERPKHTATRADPAKGARSMADEYIAARHSFDHATSSGARISRIRRCTLSRRWTSSEAGALPPVVALLALFAPLDVETCASLRLLPSQISGP